MEGIFFPGSILYYAYGAVSLSSDPAGCSFSVLQMCDQPGSVSSCAPDAEIYRGPVRVWRDHIRAGREAVEGRVFYGTNSKRNRSYPVYRAESYGLQEEGEELCLWAREGNAKTVIMIRVKNINPIRIIRKERMYAERKVL